MDDTAHADPMHAKTLPRTPCRFSTITEIRDPNSLALNIGGMTVKRHAAVFLREKGRYDMARQHYRRFTQKGDPRTGFVIPKELLDDLNALPKTTAGNLPKK